MAHQWWYPFSHAAEQTNGQTVDILDLQAMLRANRRRMTEIFQNARAGGYFTVKLGQALSKAETLHSKAVVNVQWLRETVGLPPWDQQGLAGVGAVVTGTVIAIGSIAGGAVILAGIYAAINYTNKVLAPLARAEEKEADNRAAIISAGQEKQRQAEAAAASGDTEKARQLSAEANALLTQAGTPGVPGGPPSTAGVGGLLVPLGLLAAGVFVLPRILNAFR